MGHHRLGFILAVLAPKTEAHKVVVLARREARQSVEPVLHSLEVPGGDVVVEVGIVVTRLSGLLGREIPSLLQGFGEETPRSSS